MNAAHCKNILSLIITVTIIDISYHFTCIIFRPHYIVGPADLLFDGNPTSVRGLQLTFDSGSTYTYFTPQIYNAIFNQVRWKLKTNARNFIILLNFVVIIINFYISLLIRDSWFRWVLIWKGSLWVDQLRTKRYQFVGRVIWNHPSISSLWMKSKAFLNPWL